MRKWRIEDSAELYNINGWGLKYFSINEKGHVQVTPRENSASVDLRELMDELQLRDMTAPILIRFPDILDNRIEKISRCFAQAAEEYGYTAQNFIIYPIKVNQMKPVVEEIVGHGKKFNIGLEAGSKPELHAVLAINTDKNSLIICNGYKDETYIELALLAQKMGRRIKNALREAAQFYVQLQQMGFKVDFVDIGGGLGVDYDGSRSSSSESSMNYSIQEYVNDSVSTLVDACNKNKLPQPNIITESGRSLTAHHSVLIFEVLETTSLPIWEDREELDENAHELAKELYNIWDNMNMPRMLESWHDALQIREEALDLFSLGMLDLATRAQIEKLFWSIAREVNQMALGMKHAPEELRAIQRLLPDKYFCNFSLFQSLPDSWAIDQIFPIMPIGRLDERPDRLATLQDITCDSDGKITNFITNNNMTPGAMPVHTIGKEPYYIGVFLVGAYQEILGDLHNLFGDTNAVHISVYKDRYEIDQIIDGETVAEVLDYVQFSPKKLVRSVETWVTTSMKAGIITPEEGREFLSNYRSGLYGYTYLETD